MRHVLGCRAPMTLSKANEDSAATFSPDSPAADGWLQLRHLNCLTPHLQSCPGPLVMVYAIGFERELPGLEVDGAQMQVPSSFAGYDSSDGSTGLLHGVSRDGQPAAQPLPCLYGNGLAFPSQDPSSRSYEAASIPLFIQRAVAVADDVVAVHDRGGHEAGACSQTKQHQSPQADVN